MKDKTGSLFPSRKNLKQVCRHLSSPKVLGSTVLSEDASEVDKLKYKTCEAILKYLKRKSLNQKELSRLLEIDEARVSEILHYKVERFTLDRLVGYAQILYPNLKLDLKAA